MNYHNINIGEPMNIFQIFYLSWVDNLFEDYLILPHYSLKKKTRAQYNTSTRCKCSTMAFSLGNFFSLQRDLNLSQVNSFTWGKIMTCIAGLVYTCKEQSYTPQWWIVSLSESYSRRVEHSLQWHPSVQEGRRGGASHVIIMWPLFVTNFF